ncbi:hypothetical protein B0T25DRAFT_631877 [Lasiosphaeria hispida]|uniref:Uncharacterized protein n=1 Tax=Lasiosphaeria hispida TaxID=260671 RepID=A0AAJ0HII7_9PEZI|nr:hypothetical protein B0T25DRAFT_631877 [Lasiosphaeria hispida]
MSPEEALASVKYDVYHIIANSLESIRRLPAPVGPLAGKVAPGAGPDGTLMVASIFAHRGSPISILTFTTTDGHMGPSKYAQYFAKHPNLRTIVVVQLALPTQIETDRQLRRLAENSVVSVLTKVNGTVKIVVPREPLSTPGGAIKLWLSDLVEQEDVKSLAAEFIRPLYNEANNCPANTTIPYATALLSLLKWYRVDGHMAKEMMDRSVHMSGGNGLKPGGGGGGGGKRSFSILAGGNTASKTFGPVPDSGNKPGGGSERSLSTPAGGYVVKGNMLGHDGGKRFLSGYGSYQQRPTERAMLRPRFPRMAKPVEAMIAPWGRLLARLPRKR